MYSKIEKQVLGNKNFRKLATIRRRISFSFLFFLLGLYAIFGTLSVYAPEVLSRPVFADGVVPFGIVMGYMILALTFILTLVYVYIANHLFEQLEKKVIASLKTGVDD